VLLTVKSNQKTLYRQIGSQFQGKRHIPFTASDHEKRHGRDTLWELSAKEAPEHIQENWPGSAWIVEVITDTVKAGGQRTVRRHLFLTSIRTTPDALLRLIRQRWSIENEWHWARDAQLGEDAHRYANRTGAPVFSFLRTIVMNLLRRGGYRSIRQGLRELAYDIKGMLALGGVTTPAPRLDRTFRQPCPLPALRQCDGNHRCARARNQPSASLKPSTRGRK
jgi:predicted transposase YbfD/YdcC